MVETQVDAPVMCPLPKGYHWHVTFVPNRHDGSVHLKLEHGKECLQSICTTLGFQNKTVEEIVGDVMKESWSLWGKEQVRPANEQALLDKINAVTEKLGPNVIVEVRNQ